MVSFVDALAKASGKYHRDSSIRVLGRGSSVEEEEKKRGSVRGDVTLTPPYATPGLRKAAIIIPIT